MQTHCAKDALTELNTLIVKKLARYKAKFVKGKYLRVLMSCTHSLGAKISCKL